MPKLFDAMMPDDLPIPHGALAVWVIYSSPSDHPGKFVLRPQFAMPGGKEQVSELAWTADTIDDLREPLIQMGLVMLQRHPNDDPKIVETWI